MEYVLGALNGCLSVVVELVAKERGIVLRDLKISSSGLVDQRGLFGTADVSPHFQSVEVAVTMATSAPSTEEFCGDAPWGSPSALQQGGVDR